MGRPVLPVLIGEVVRYVYEVSLGQDTSDYWTNEVLYLMIRGS